MKDSIEYKTTRTNTIKPEFKEPDSRGGWELLTVYVEKASFSVNDLVLVWKRKSIPTNE